MTYTLVSYCDGLIFENNTLKQASIEGGYVTFNGTTPQYHFYIQDHQGNNRLVCDESGTIEQVNHYYPYGGLMGESEDITSTQRYKYNGKELDRMHGLNLYDYGARQYDATVGLFTTMDPMCEKYYNVSPYAYCVGNPVNAIDPDGRDWYRNNETSYYTWFNQTEDIEGFVHIGDKGSVLGEFEGIIDNILCGEGGLGLESLYSEGFTFDIAPKDKGALMGSKERGWDFFDEFINGTGPEFSVLLGNHPYTKEMKNDSKVIESQRILLSGNTEIEGQITNVPRKWHPIDIFTTGSIVKQFIGSYRYDGYISKDGNYVNNVILDSKSRTSLFYHGGLDNPRRNVSKTLGNTYQFYIWKSKK